MRGDAKKQPPKTSRREFPVGEWRDWLSGGVLGAVLVLSWPVGRASSDLYEYAYYAARALHPPWFSHWPVEYPPLALLTFLPAYWGVGVLQLCLAFGTLLLWMRLRQASPAGARRWVVLLALGGVGTILGRYDVFPTLMGVLAVLDLEAGRFRWAWVWSWASAALKLFGAALWPLIFIAEWRARRRLPVWSLAGVVTAMVLTWFVPLLTTPDAALTWVAWLLRRPIEVESLAAPVELLWAHHAHFVASFGSYNIVSRHAGLIGLLLLGVLAIAEVRIWMGLYTGRLDIRTAAALAVTWLLLTGKVLSAQYLLWVFPLWALAADGTWLYPWGYAAALLTTVVFPVLYQTTESVLWYVAAATLRNLALVAATAVLWRANPAASGWAWAPSIMRPPPE